MINNRHWWATFPMLRFLVPWIVGLLLYQPGSLPSWAVPGAATCILLVWCLQKKHLIPGAPRPLRALPIICTYLVLGYMLMHLSDVRNHRAWAGQVSLPQACYLGKALGTSRPARSNFATEFKLIAAKTRSNKWHSFSALVRITHKGPELKQGYLAVLTTELSAITQDQATQNGFYQYLLSKNIHHVSNTGQAWIQIIDSSEQHSLTYTVRSKLSAMLDSLFTDKGVRAFSGALLIGERSDLDAEIKDAYSRTGVIHVIAISGMHLALIYALLAGMLRFLKKGRLKWIFTILCLGVLWIYAFVCGNSPSIARSAWMFSFLLVGDQLNRPASTGNSLCASAFTLLCIQPTMLWDIGFQLSFAAVGSLLIYQEPIKRWYQPDNKVLQYCWEMIATTLAAQILTTPLVIYHFHQFSLVFLLSNLVAVPLSSLLLILLGICCILFPLGLAAPLAHVSENIIGLMNQRILALSELRFAVASDLHLRISDTIAVYAILLIMTLWIRLKKR